MVLGQFKKRKSKKSGNVLQIINPQSLLINNQGDPNPIPSRRRQRKPSEARAIFSYLAVEETGYPAADVARFLGVKRMSVHEAVTRGKALCDEYALLGQKYE